MTSPKQISLGSSLDGGPLDPQQPRNQSFSQPSFPSLHHRLSVPTHASSPGIPRPSQAIPLEPLQTSSALPNPVIAAAPPNFSLNFSQASSSISKPSPSFVTAYGESYTAGNLLASNGDRDCVGQMDFEDGPRGPKNPYGVSLDKGTGYFPQGSEATPGTIQGLLRMIAAERLHQMPQKGSNWDRVIRTLESTSPRFQNPSRSAAKQSRFGIENV